MVKSPFLDLNLGSESKVPHYRLPSEMLLKREFGRLKNPIKIALFISKKEEPNCSASIEFMSAIANPDPRIELDIISIESSPDLFEKHNITEVPTIIVNETGIQYTGVPSGPETVTFIQTLVMASTKNSGIGDVIKKIIASLTKSVYLRTIVTSECTICPLAVKIGNMLSLESSFSGNGMIRHEIIESIEHEEYVSEYDLSSVPIVLINEEVAFNGVPDVDKYILKIAAAGK